MTDDQTERERGANTLVLLFHAYTMKPEDLEPIKTAVREQWPEARVEVPELGTSLLSWRDANEVVVELLERVDRLVEDAAAAGRQFERIVLVGHSIGALMARKLYVVACGETERAPFEKAFRTDLDDNVRVPPRAWALRVERIVQLAGMNRGWRISHHLGFVNAVVHWLASGVLQAVSLVTRRRYLIFDIRRGAPFITQLRIQWLLMRARSRAGSDRGSYNECAGDALTVQLLGSRDDMVAPEDNIDLVSGGDFVYLDVPYSGHADVIRFHERDHGAGRKDVFLDALTGSPETLRERAVVPSDEHFIEPDYAIERMVFVIHGIRDRGYWTHKIARRVRERVGGDRDKWATETSSYGYFPMLPFLFPWYRRQKVEWLMDQYAEALARYPNAKISYIGHSNGTYLVAKALETYPCCFFDNIVFAGSVVHTRYDWKRFLEVRPPRVNAVLNFVATRDWVVAFFPKLFEVLGLQDLGAAGHDGFVIRDDKVNQVTYVRGGHAAALAEPIWDVIADFVITGRVEENDIPGLAREPSRVIRLLGLFPPIVWLVAAGAIWLGWLGIDTTLCRMISYPEPLQYARGLATAAYAGLIWLILTRV